MKKPRLTNKEIEACQGDLLNISKPIAGRKVVTWTVYPTPDNYGRVRVLGAYLDGNHVNTVGVRIPTIEKPEGVRLSDNQFKQEMIIQAIRKATRSLLR